MKTTHKFLKSISLLILIAISSNTFSQQGINYQGVARDAESELLANADITLDINIVKTTIDGTIVYSESHDLTTDVSGVFSTVIGNGTPTLNLYTDINWAEGQHFLNVWLNGVEVGSTEFVNVPYANAIGKWQAHNNGVTTKGTGGSVYIGENVGVNDNLSDPHHNIGIGDGSLQNVASGFYNNAQGYQALYSNTSGHRNIANGNQALYNNTIGLDNMATGYRTLFSNTTGSNNLAFGAFALFSNTVGNANIGMGLNSLGLNTTGNNNVAIGKDALASNNTGDFNIAVGHEALLSNTSGEQNIANGYNTLHSNTTGTRNIAIGREAMQHNTTGFVNIGLGILALNFNTTGNSNIAIGSSALYSNTIGVKNIALGGSAGQNTDGNYNIFIGTLAGLFETGSNKLHINNHIVPDAFPLIYGEFDNEILGFDAKVGIGTKTPQLPLQVATGLDVTLANGSGQVIIGTEGGANIVMDSNEIQARNNGAAADLYLQNEGGNVRVGGAVVHASDRRLKQDIEDISFGLKEILQLEPKEYFWKGIMQENKSLGLIAQDVDEVIKNVVTYNVEEDKYGVSYTELIPVLIKAIQEQQKIIDSQKRTSESQSKEISGLESRLEILETKLLQLR